MAYQKYLNLVHIYIGIKGKIFKYSIDMHEE
jgi:hypothetical protein